MEQFDRNISLGSCWVSMSFVKLESHRKATASTSPRSRAAPGGWRPHEPFDYLLEPGESCGLGTFQKKAVGIESGGWSDYCMIACVYFYICGSMIFLDGFQVFKVLDSSWCFKYPHATQNRNNTFSTIEHHWNRCKAIESHRFNGRKTIKTA